MTSQLSERFHDFERRDLYEEVVLSSMNVPVGSEQAHLLDMLTPVDPLPSRHASRLPHLSLRWFSLPRLPVPFLTWA